MNYYEVSTQSGNRALLTSLKHLLSNLNTFPLSIHKHQPFLLFLHSFITYGFSGGI